MCGGGGKGMEVEEVEGESVWDHREDRDRSRVLSKINRGFFSLFFGYFYIRLDAAEEFGKICDAVFTWSYIWCVLVVYITGYECM